MDFFAVIFIVFFVFVLFSLCGFCCKKNEEGAVFTTPVVITSATHQPPGQINSYPIHTEQTTILTSQQPVGMPMPFNQSGYSPYPPASGMTPYPPVNQSGTYQPSYPNASAPYPTMNPATMNPPSYHEIMGSTAPPPSQPNAMNADFYQKQSPYNPGYPQ